jgi:murein DD-endopeptidase MepM/ murein hydrolase activator NlpD
VAVSTLKIVRLGVSVGAVWLGLASSLAAQRKAPADIIWQPDSLIQGSIMRVGVRPSSEETVVEVTGAAAGQALRFEADSIGVFWALAGLPMDAAEQLSLDLVLRYPDRTDTTTISLPVSRRNAPMERLKVAPEFGRQPDSALEARVQGERARARRVSRESHQTPRHWHGPFVRPRDSRVTGQFGRGRLYNGQVTGRHMGVDLAGKLGEPVYAANHGVVALVADFYYAGKAVYLDHGAGLVTAYFHLSNADVLQGDLVSKGQQIGTVGASGRVTGPHLHWVARYGTISVDAESLLELVGK